MARYIEMVKSREEEIAKLIELLSKKSSGFNNPKLILIGGYALRAFTTFSRTTRDCDLVLPKKNGWHLDTLRKWLAAETTIEALEKKRKTTQVT